MGGQTLTSRLAVARRLVVLRHHWLHKRASRMALLFFRCRALETEARVARESVRSEVVRAALAEWEERQQQRSCTTGLVATITALPRSGSHDAPGVVITAMSTARGNDAAWKKRICWRC